MKRAAAGKQGFGDGNSNRTADVADEVEDAAGVSDFLVAQRSVALRGDGDEDEAERKAGNDNGPEEGPRADGEADIAEGERHGAEDDEAEGEQVAGVPLVGEITDDGHGNDGAESARADDHAGGKSGVAEHLLIKERQQRDGGVNRHPEKE